jgi:putative cell wall-binding protein
MREKEILRRVLALLTSVLLVLGTMGSSIPVWAGSPPTLVPVASGVTGFFDANGGKLLPKAGQFSFKLTYLRGNLANFTELTTTNKDGGSIEFDLSKADLTTVNGEIPIAVFELTEVRGNDASIQYSSAKYYMGFGVSSEGVYSSEFYTGLEADGPVNKISADEVMFKNIHTVQVKAAKILADSLGNQQALTDGQFKFKLTCLAAAGYSQKPADISAANLADGSISFDMSNFDYSADLGAVTLFEMSEVPGNRSDISYSTEKYYVTISDGGATVLYFNSMSVDDATNGIDESEVVFHNTLNTPVVHGIKILKDSKGNQLNLTDGQFRFKLSYLRGSLVNKPADIFAANLSDGSIPFDMSSVDFENDPRAMTVFEMSEVAGNNPDIIYSREKYYVVVGGSNDGSGMTVTYYKNITDKGPTDEIIDLDVIFHNKAADSSWERNIAWERLGGADRYETAAVIAKKAFPNGSDSIVLVTGENFPDALSVSGFAGVRKIPIMITTTANLSRATADVIKAWGVKKVTIVGGTAAVSDSVKNQLTTAAGVPADGILRVAGSDRYETAEAVYDQGVKEGIWTKDSVPVIASGNSAADALSISPWSYAYGMPVLLANKGIVSARSLEIAKLANASSKYAFICGGSSAVNMEAEDELRAAGIKVHRFAGFDRYDTSAMIAKYFAGDKIDPMGKTGEYNNTMFAAGGDTHYTDSLVSSMLQARYKKADGSSAAAPILLVDGTSGAGFDLVKNEYVKADISMLYVAGGTAAVSEETAAAVMSNWSSVVRIPDNT